MKFRLFGKNVEIKIKDKTKYYVILSNDFVIGSTTEDQIEYLKSVNKNLEFMEISEAIKEDKKIK